MKTWPEGGKTARFEDIVEPLLAFWRRAAVPLTKEARFKALCKSFHQLERAPHIDPFDATALDDWLNDSGARTSGLQACVSFVLWVCHGGVGYERVNPFKVGDEVRERAIYVDDHDHPHVGKVTHVEDDKIDVTGGEHDTTFRRFEFADAQRRKNYCAEHQTTGWGFRTPPFDMIRALQVWDKAHAAAFAAWAADPFWF